MLSETPENMVFCFPKSNLLLEEKMKEKNCSIIDCSKDWSKSRLLVLAKNNNKCVNKCIKTAKFENAVLSVFFGALKMNLDIINLEGVVIHEKIL